MGYLHISNLYKDTRVLDFKEVYIMEKIDGSSSNIYFKQSNNDSIEYFPGCEKLENYKKLFDESFLLPKAKEYFNNNPNIQELTLFGEVYGGKIQGQSKMYGIKTKFIVFDVLVNNRWLNVPEAETISKYFNQEFVWYRRVISELEVLTNFRNSNTHQGERNGINEPYKQEGIIIRPLFECYDVYGNRIIAKYKNDEFRETKKTRKVRIKEKLEVLKEAEHIAEEWVTYERVKHVFNSLISKNYDMTNINGETIKTIGREMIDDIKREGKDEILWSKEVEQSIYKKTIELYKIYLAKSLFNDKL